MKTLLFVALASFATCSSPQPVACHSGATRCDGPTASICTPEGRWVPFMGCGAIENGVWGCEVIDGSATCVEVEDAAP